MNSQTQVMTKTDNAAADLGVAIESETLEEKLEALSNTKLEEYYAERDELHERIKRLTKIGDQRKIDAAKSELNNVEKEIAKRAENVGVAMADIGREMGMFKDLGNQLAEDTPEDIAKREAAHQDLTDAENAIIEAKAKIAAAETAKIDAEAAKKAAEKTRDDMNKTGPVKWFKRTFTSQLDDAMEAVRDAGMDIGAAEQVINRGPDVLAQLEADLEAAKANILSTEEQIDIDKDHRLRQLNLDKLNAKLTKAETQVKGIVQKNIKALKLNITNTDTQLAFDRKTGVEAAARLEEIEAEIEILTAKFETASEELDDLQGDETSMAYMKKRNEASQLATKLDKFNGEMRIVKSKISTAQVNVSELEALKRALVSDLELAKHNYNDFVQTAKKARVSGEGIAQLLKGQAAKVSASSLARGRDAMTLASVDASIATDIANRDEMANRAERRVQLLDQMDTRISAGDAAAAEKDARFNEATEAYKDKYRSLNSGGSEAPSTESEEVSDGGSDGEKEDELY